MPTLTLPVLTVPFTRQQYMDQYGERFDQDRAAASALHRRYYAQYCSPELIEIVGRHFAARLVCSTVPSFNDIPLRQWDLLALTLQLRQHVKARMLELGDYYSDAGAVCILKEAAHLWVELHSKLAPPERHPPAAPNELHIELTTDSDFRWALSNLRNGLSVRRTDWRAWLQWNLHKNRPCSIELHWPSGVVEPYRPILDDLVANDWRIVP